MILLILLFSLLYFETTGVSTDFNNDFLAIAPIPDNKEPIPSLPLIKITLLISDTLENEQNMISNNGSKKET